MTSADALSAVDHQWKRLARRTLSVALLGIPIFCICQGFVCPAEATVLRDRRLHRGPPGVTAQAPDGWGFSTQTGYPAIMFLLVHPDGSRLSLGRGKTVGASGAVFADQNRAALRASGFRVEHEAEGPRQSRVLDLQSPGGEWKVRQLYFVRSASVPPQRSEDDSLRQTRSSSRSPDDGLRDGFVATLVATPDLLQAHGRDLMAFVDALSFDEEP